MQRVGGPSPALPYPAPSRAAARAKHTLESPFGASQGLRRPSKAKERTGFAYSFKKFLTLLQLPARPAASVEG